METRNSWLKAWGGAIVIHLLLVFIAAIFVTTISIKPPETYVIDLSTSDFSGGRGSGHAGGGSGGGKVAFPDKLSTEDVAKRVAQVEKQLTTAAANTNTSDMATPTASAASSSENTTGAVGSATTGNGAGTGLGGAGNGQGTGEGDGIGDGRGYGEGSGDGRGQGYGDSDGTGSGNGEGNYPFDVGGFQQRVQDYAQMPSEAATRNIDSGHVEVVVTLNTEGGLINMQIASSTDSIFNEPALDAVRAATPYPNPTGDTMVITVPIDFSYN